VGSASLLGVQPVADLVADAVVVGRRLGLAVDDPVVLKDSLNLLVWLRPSPVVARIQARTGLVRGPEALADSLALARFLADAGQPVSPPVEDIDAGPHVAATGRAMTFWRYLDVRDEPADPFEVGRSLRRIHEAAAAYDGPLRHVGPVEEIGRLAALLAPHRPEEAAHVIHLRDAIELPVLPAQAVHGDAHLGNVAMTSGGLCWLDWEESWRGPIAWDLACLDHQRRTFGERTHEIGRALEGYGAYDAEAAEAWLPVVALWAATWGLVGGLEGREGWTENARRRLSWLEAHLSG
jgi:Ser/Thr protein kinase RdoA (MazF antagonist)